jgi:Glycosyltransferase sugar-binding region containing DXD motif
MNESHLPVSAHAHFIWTGSGFALSHRLAVESLLLTNPDFYVTLHLIGDPSPRSPDIDALRGHPRVEIRPATARDVLARCEQDQTVWQTYQRIPTTAASAQSNLLRYAILWSEGGIYLDLDVLVLRSLAPLRTAACTLGTELVWRADEARVAGQLAPWMITPSVAFIAALALRRADVALGTWMPPGWQRWLEPHWSTTQPNNAVIAATPRAPFVTALLERAPRVDASVRFRLGPTLVTEVARQRPDDVMLLPPDRLYFVPPSQSFRFFADRQLQVPATAMLLHYVSSNHRRELQAVARGGLQALPPSLFRRLATDVLAGRVPDVAAISERVSSSPGQPLHSNKTLR